MKYILALILSFLIFVYGYSQVNLVPNPSFEDTVFCPQGIPQMYACQNWATYGNCPDYYHECTPIFGIPTLPFGYQYAHSGAAMIGLCLWRKASGPDGPNYREYAGV